MEYESVLKLSSESDLYDGNTSATINTLHIAYSVIEHMTRTRLTNAK